MTNTCEREGYSIKHGYLYYKDRLVLSKDSVFIPLLLTEFHEGVHGGHSGVLKTLKRLQNQFYWSKMKKDVQRFVAECLICQTHKYSTLSPAGLLQPLPVPDQIWSHLSMDFVEWLPKSEGVNVIMVVVDRLSKFAHFIRLRHPFTAIQIAHKFAKEVVRLHGVPDSIVSDRDKLFQSTFWKETHRLARTKLNFSSAYHPESDGQTEVVNRCLETYLRCFASSHPRNWAKFLHWAELWYNTSYHTALQATPFKIVYGRDPPKLLKYEAGSTKNFELEESLKTRDLMLQEIKAHLLRAQELMKNNANKHRRDLEFAVGDWVFLKLRPYRQQSVAKRICQKLAARYYGPFEVEARVGPVAYRLSLPASSSIHPVFHVSLLKPVLGKNHVVNPLPEVFSEWDEFIVDIRDSRYTDGGDLEVLVLWKGLPAHEQTWVLIRELVQQFPTFELGDKLSCEGGGGGY